jgi:hypothetical protein
LAQIVEDRGSGQATDATAELSQSADCFLAIQPDGACQRASGLFLHGNTAGRSSPTEGVDDRRIDITNDNLSHALNMRRNRYQCNRLPT